LCKKFEKKPCTAKLLREKSVKVEKNAACPPRSFIAIDVSLRSVEPPIMSRDSYCCRRWRLMSLESNNEAEEGDNSGSAGGVGLVGGALEGSGLLTNASARGSCGLGGSAVAVGSLNLTVGDLGNRADGGSSLDLAVGDLRNSSASGGSGAGLDLAVGDLGDGSAGGSGGAGLDLTVGNLAHGSTGCASLDLTIGDLGDTD
jgi:hypothetical protein